MTKKIKNHSNYNNLLSHLKSSRALKNGKKIQNNTHLRLESGDLIVRLHSTDVARVSPDGMVSLNSGGWQTITTRERIEGHTPARIGSIGGDWYVVVGPWDNAVAWKFQDGIKLDAKGRPIGRGNGAPWHDIMRASRRERAKASREREARFHPERRAERLLAAKRCRAYLSCAKKADQVYVTEINPDSGEAGPVEVLAPDAFIERFNHYRTSRFRDAWRVSAIKLIEGLAHCTFCGECLLGFTPLEGGDPSHEEKDCPRFKAKPPKAKPGDCAGEAQAAEQGERASEGAAHV